MGIAAHNVDIFATVTQNIYARLTNCSMCPLPHIATEVSLEWHN